MKLFSVMNRQEKEIIYRMSKDCWVPNAGAAWAFLQKAGARAGPGEPSFAALPTLLEDPTSLCLYLFAEAAFDVQPLLGKTVVKIPLITKLLFVGFSELCSSSGRCGTLPILLKISGMFCY